MAKRSAWGSLTKEPPLSKLDATLQLATAGMTYDQLRARTAASAGTHPDAPGLVKQRFLTLDSSDRIQYDGLLALMRTYGVSHPRVRKVMYFVWVWRDARLRRFLVERVAGPSGEWRPAELTNKDNASFFQEFLQASSATKARSNFEFFLTEAGIFNPKSGKVNLDLSDGWLSDAMAIVAREEDNPTRRAEMMRNPAGFLVAEKLNALINLPAGTQPPNYPGALETIELLDDTVIPAPPKGAPGGKGWKPRGVSESGGKTLDLTVDLVARERASKAHQQLERIAAAAIEEKGFAPLFTQNIDMFYSTPKKTVLLEMKSCHTGNIHSQIRKGVSQLLEYRYLHRNEFKGGTDLALVLETPLPDTKEWLNDYLTSVDVLPTWKHASADVLITSKPIPEALAGVVSSESG